MKKYRLHTIIIGLFLLFNSCNQKSTKTVSIDELKWKLVQCDSNDLNLKIGDTLEFINKNKICKLGKLQQMIYYTNDTVILFIDKNQQRVFKIEHDNYSLSLEEIYNSTQAIYKFKAIRN